MKFRELFIVLTNVRQKLQKSKKENCDVILKVQYMM